MAAEVTLLDAARRGDEAAFEQLVEPHRAELHAHCYRMLASVQDAEDALQEALLGAWRGLAALRGPQLAALVALQGRDQRLPEARGAPAQARAPGRLRPGRRPARRARRAGARAAVGRALSRRRPRLRAARERRARVHRGAPAPARAPARGADPQRGARLLGRGGRRGARDDARLGLQRAPARAQDRRRAPPPPEPAGDAARARRRTPARAGRPSTSPPGSAATSTRSPRC